MSCCSLNSEAHGNILQLQENEWLQFLKLPFLQIANWFLGFFLQQEEGERPAPSKGSPFSQ